MLPPASPTIAPARYEQAGGCRRLLPEAFPVLGPAPMLFAAADEAGRIVGAAALAWVPSGFPVLVRVEPAWRRRGIGSALLDAACREAAGETALVRSWSPLPEDDPAVPFLLAAGFRVAKRLVVFETDGARFQAATTPLLARFRSRIPPEARLITLSEGPDEDVVRLVSSELGLPPHEMARRVRPGAADGYDPSLSLVVLHAGTVIGAMLCRRVGERIEIDVNVVAPGYRRGWANLFMVEAMARRGREAGATAFRFSCEEHVTDTLNLGRRTGARSLPAQLALARPLYSAADA